MARQKAGQTTEKPLFKPHVLMAAIRQSVDAFHEHVLMDEIGFSRENVERKVAENNAKCGPSWAEANPVKRITRIEIREIPD